MIIKGRVSGRFHDITPEVWEQMKVNGLWRKFIIVEAEALRTKQKKTLDQILGEIKPHSFTFQKADPLPEVPAETDAKPEPTGGLQPPPEAKTIPVKKPSFVKKKNR